jgi:hypothetical protein
MLREQTDQYNPTGFNCNETFQLFSFSAFQLFSFSAGILAIKASLNK